MARNGNLIRAGIEFNALGKRVAYWMYRRHPGDSTLVGGGYNQLVRVPASEVLHIFEPLEAGQLRGVPRLSRVLLRLKSLDNYDDAVLFRQEVSNLFAGFITRETPQQSGPPVMDPVTGAPIRMDGDGFTPMVGLEPGTMQELLPGESVEFTDPPDAGNTYPDFMRHSSKLPRWALAFHTSCSPATYGTSTTGLSGWCSTSSAGAWSNCSSASTSTSSVARFGRPGWTWPSCRGLSSCRDYARRRREYLRTRWVPQGWEYIHPVQDVQGKIFEINAGLTSRSEVVLRKGYDAETIDEQNAADQARARDLGLHYSIGGADASTDEEEGKTP